MLDDSLKRLIDRELTVIHMLLERSGNLLNVDPNVEPTFERLAALSQVLISFYTGLERIFERVARRIDHSLPLREEIQSDGRIRRWVRIPEFENRSLRVILLPDGRTVHNAFFDRSFGGDEA